MLWAAGCGSLTLEGPLPPMADAGFGRNAITGSEVTLDGTASKTADGQDYTQLAFSWSLVAVPVGSTATLSDPGAAQPTFMVDLRGDYLCRLTVSYQGAESLPDVVLVHGYRPLEIVSQTPTPGTFDAQPDTPVVVVFSEAVQPESITPGSLYVLPEGSRDPLPGVTTVSQGNTISVFQPSIPMQRGRRMTAVVTQNVVSLEGATLVAGYRGPFVISLGPDLSQPTVVNVVPAAGAVDVATSQAVLLTFSEPIDAATVNATSVLVSDSTGPLAGQLDLIAGDTQVMFVPAAPYALGADYTVLAISAITDRAGNPLDGAGTGSASDFTSTFRTTLVPDTDPPTVASIYPGDGFANVLTSAAIVIELNEPIDTTTVTSASFMLEGTAGSLAGTLSFSNGNRVVTLVPTALLDVGTDYTVTLTDAVTDVAGNALDGDEDGTAGGQFQSSFSTSATADLIAIDLVPAAPHLHIGEAVQMTATGNFSDNTTQDITDQVFWSTTLPGIASVDSLGLVTGVAVGSTSVSAQQLGREGSQTVTVWPVVSISPPTTSTPPRGLATFVGSGGDGSYLYMIEVNNSGGSIDPVSGLYTAGGNGNLVDTVRVEDSIGGFAEALVTITAPVAIAPVSATAVPLQSVAFSATGGDGTYVYSLSDNQSGGSVNPSTGVYISGPVGSVVDTVRVTDGLGELSEATVTIGPALSLLPAPPIAVFPLESVVFSAAGGDGTYTYSLLPNSSGGFIDPSTGSYTAGPVGSVVDTVAVTDGLGAQVTVDVNVLPALAISPSAVSVPPLGAVTFSATGGNGTYTYSLIIDNSGAFIDVATGLYTAGSTGGVTDTVQLTDGLGAISQAQIAVGNALRISPTSVSLPPLGTQTFSATGGVAPYSYSLVANNSGGSIDPVTGVYIAGPTGGVTDTIEVLDSLSAASTATANIGAALTITPPSAFLSPLGTVNFIATGGDGTYTFSFVLNNSGGSVGASTGAYQAGLVGNVADTVLVTDGAGATATALVSVSAAISISPPLVNLSPLGVLTFTAAGGDGNYIFSLSANNSGAIINATSGLYRAGATGAVTDTVRVTDGLGAFIDAAVTVSVNLAIAPVTTSVAPAGNTTFTATGGDGFYSYSLFLNGSGASVNPVTGAYIAGATGNTTDIVRATDGVGATADATVTVGAAVAITPATVTAAPNESIAFAASGGNGSYSFGFVSNDSGGFINPTTGAYIAGATGTVTDTVRVTDGFGQQAFATITITASIAIAPAAIPVAPIEPVTFSATGGNGVYTFSIVTSNSGGTINGATGAYVAGSIGGVVDTVRVIDGFGATANATVNVGAALAILPVSTSTAPAGGVTFAATGGDGSYTYSISTNNSGGAIVAATGAYTAGTTGNVIDTVRVTDGLGSTVTSLVSVGPQLAITPTAATLPPTGSTTFTGSGGEGTYTFSLLVNNSGATINSGTGAYVAGTTGGVSDTVRVTDGFGITADAIATVGAIVGINPAAGSIAPLGGINFTGSGGNGAYTFTLVTNNSGGSIGAATGVYVAGGTGSVSDTVRVTDGLGQFAEATIAVGSGVLINPVAAGMPPLAGATFTAGGGDGNYTYSVLVNNSGGSINAVTGAYVAGPVGSVVDTVRVVDGLGGSANAAVTVTAALTIAPVATSVAPGGGVTFAAAGGDGVYGYSIVTNNSGATIDGVTGAYIAGPIGGVNDTVRVSDGLGATATATVTITGAVAITPTTASLVPLQGQNFSGSGGDGSYTFSILINNSGGTINVATGAYVAGSTGSTTDTIRVTDGLGGTADAAVTLGPAVAITPVSVTLAPSGSQAFAGSGGSGTFTYSIQINNSGGTINSVTGFYTAGATGSVIDTIRVVDGLGGIADAIANIGGVLQLTPVSANRVPNDSVAFSASGGSPPYTYSIIINASGGTINAATGAYTAGPVGSVVDTIRVTDTLSAISDSTVNVSAAVAIAPSLVTQPPLGSVAFSASGGNGVYAYALVTNNSGGSINATTGAYLAGATGGVSDTVRVTDGLGGISTGTVNVGGAVAISPSVASPPPLGAIAFSASGGDGSYSYSLVVNNSGATINGATGSYSAGAAGGVADTVRVTDGLGSTSDATVNVRPNVAIAPVASNSPPLGIVTFTASGGNGSYTFSILVNASGASINATTGVYVAGPAGGVTDTIRVADGLGSISDTTVSVTAAVSIAPSAPTIPPLGSVAFVGAGGDASYGYAIITNNSGGSINAVTGAYLAGATGGVSDLVRVTDGLGGSADATVTVTTAIGITPSSVTRPPLGAVSFAGNGGNGTYAYAILTNNSGGSINAVTGAYVAGATGGVSDTVRVTDGLGATADSTVTVSAVISISPTTATLPPLGGQTFTASDGDGSYTFSILVNNSGGSINALSGAYVAGPVGGVNDTIRVTDGLGSVANAVVTTSAALAISPVSDIKPPLGTAVFSASGGNGTYVYSIPVNNSGATINAVTGAYTAGSVGGVADTVRVTDGLGATSDATVTVTAALAVTPATVAVAPLGAVAFSAIGGDGTYGYSLLVNNSGAAIDGVTGAYTAGNTGGVTDTVRVTDGLGATSNATVTVGANLSISPSLVSVPPVGGISFSASGGDGTYAYAILTNNSGGVIDGVTGAYTAGPTGGVADTIRLTDGVGATADATVNVGAAISISPGTASVAPLAPVNFTGSGGDNSYTFSFVLNNSGGTINPTTGAYAAGASGGVVDTIRVTDGLGSTATATVTVGAALTIAPLTSTRPPLGTVAFVAAGGNGSFTYNILTNNSGGSINPLTGAYVAGSIGAVTDTVRVTDGLGATANATVTVTAAVAIAPAAFSTPPLGGTTFTGSGGDGTYTFSFVSNNSGGSIDGPTGAYLAGSLGGVVDTVRVTDGLGATASATITVTAAVAIAPATASLVPLEGQNFTASGGDGSYTYSILINNSGGSINAATGAYVSGAVGGVTDTVRVTDGLGATASALVTLGAAVSIAPASVTLAPTGAQVFTAAGGNGSYSFSIQVNNSGGTINAVSGAYTAGSTGSVIDTIRVTDGLGGFSDALANIGGVLTLSPASANRVPNDSVLFSASGGSPAYTYSLLINQTGATINAATGAYTVGPLGGLADTVRVTDSLAAFSDAIVTVGPAVAISPSLVSRPPLGTVAFTASGGNGVFTYSLTVNNSGGAIDSGTGAYSPGATGGVSDTVRVTDSLGGFSEATVTVTAAVAIAPTVPTPPPLGAVNFTATGGDGSYSYSIVTNNSGGSINAVTGAYTAGSTGSVTDTVRVTDGLGSTSDASVSVGPVLAIAPVSPSVAPTGGVAFSASGGNGSYTFSILINSSGAVINGVTGTYTAGGVGSVVDTIRVTDGLGATRDTTVTVTAALAISPTTPSTPPLGSVSFTATGGDGSYNYSLVTNNSGGSLNAITGAYVAGPTGSVIDTVRVTDGLGAFSQTTVNVVAPLAINPTSASRPPLGGISFSGSGGSSPYTYSIAANNSGGTIGAVTGAYVAGTTGSVTDTVRVTDSLGANSDATVTITPAVAISPATLSTPPLGGTTFSATGGDSSYTFSILVNNSGGAINSVSGVYAAGTTGGVTDTVRVTDGLGGVSDAAVTVSAAVAIAPATFSTPPLGGSTFTASGGDSSFVFVMLVNNSGGSVNGVTGAYTAGPTGSVSDTVRVTDGLGGVSDAIVTVSAAVAIAPAAPTIAPTGSVAFSASGGDASYTYSFVANNSGGTLNAVTGAYVAGSTGSVTDTVRVTDSLGGTSNSPVTVGAVLAIAPSTVSRAPGEAVAFGAAGGDGSYGYSFVTNNSGGSINAVSGAYVAGAVGSVADTVRVTDGLGVTADATVTIGPALTINPATAARPPLGATTFSGVGGDGSYLYSFVTNNSLGSINAVTGVYVAGPVGAVVDTVRVTDGVGFTTDATITVGPEIAIAPATASGPPLSGVSFSASGGDGSYTYSILTNNSGGSINVATGAYTAGGIGSVVDTIRVTDGLGATSDATVTLTAAVVIAPLTFSTPPLGGTTFTASGGDGGYSFSFVTNNSGGSIDNATGAYLAGAVGGVSDTVRVTDGLGAASSATVTVTAAVGILPTTVNLIPLQGQNFTASGGDGSFTYSLLVNNSGGSINGVTGAYVAGSTGSVTDTVRATDGLGGVADATVTLSAAVSIAPAAVTLAPLQSQTFTGAGGDGTFTYALFINNSGGSVNAVTGAYTAGATGSVIDTIRVTDGLGGFADSVANIGGALTISPASASRAPLGSVAFNASGGAPAYSYTLLINNSGGSINAVTGAYAAGPTGSVSDTVRVSDSVGATSDAIVTVTAAISIAPSVVAPPPFGAVAFSASGGNGVYTYGIQTNNSGGSINGTTGAYTAGATGSVTDTVRVTDGLGATSDATVNVGATLAISPTTATPPPFGAVAFSATGGDGSYSYSIALNNSGASINAVTGAYAAGPTGSVSDTVRVTDGLGATSDATVNVGPNLAIAPVSPSSAPTGSIAFSASGGNGTYAFSILTNNSGATINATTGAYTAGTTGAVNDAVRVTDGLGATSDTTVTVTAALAIAPATVSIAPLGPVAFSASGGDGTYVFSILTNNSGGSINSGTGAYLAGGTGGVVDTVRVTDGLGVTRDAAVTVTAVLTVAPAAVSRPPFGAVAFAAADGSGSYTFSLLANNSGGSIVPGTGAYLAGAVGSVSDTVRVTDSFGATADATVNVTAAVAIAPATFGTPPLGGTTFTASGGDGSYTFSMLVNASGGSVNGVTGVYAAGSTGGVTDTVRVTDGLGGVSDATVTISAAVAITPLTFSTPPLGGTTFTSSGGDAGYTYTLFVNNSGGSVNAVTGAYTAGTIGGVSDTVRVTDGLGGTSDATVTVTAAVAIAPATPAIAPTGPIAFSASGGDSSFTYAFVTNNSGGSINAVSGAYVAGTTGNVIDTVRVTDGLGGNSTATITVGPVLAVAPVAPAVAPGVGVAFSATGGDGSYTYSLLIDNSGATINVATGAYTAGSTGGVNDTVRVTDGLGVTSDATVTVGPSLTINPAVTAGPPLGSVAFTGVGGDGSYTYSFVTNNSGGSINTVSGAYVAGPLGSVVDTVRVTDGVAFTADATINVGLVIAIAPATPSGPPLSGVGFSASGGDGSYTFSILTNNSGGSINVSTGAYLAGPTGSVADTVRVTDGLGATSDATMTVTVAIAIAPATFSTPPLGGTTFTASGGDGSFTFSFVTNNSGGTINGASGVYSAGTTGGVADTVRVTDGLGATSTATITVTAAVAILPTSVNLIPLQGQNFAASGGDSSYTYSILVNNSGGTINGATGAYVSGPTGSVTDTIRVTDGLGGVADATVNLSAAVAISPTAVTLAPLQAQTFTGSGGDGTYAYSLFLNNSGGSINAATGAYVAGATGSVSDTIRVTDGLGGIADAVANIGGALTITPATATRAPLGSVSFVASGGAPPYTYSMFANNSGGSVNATTGAYAAGGTGSVSDTVRVTDSLFATSDAVVTITAAIAISPSTATPPPLGAVAFSATGGNGVFTFSILTNNSGGSINATTGAYTAGTTGSVTDTVRVSDGLGASSDATVTVGPVLAIAPATATPPPFGAVAFSASGGNGSYTYSILVNNSGGSINAVTGGYLAGATGSVVDTVRVTDGLSATSDSTVTVGANLAIAPAAPSVAPTGPIAFSASGGDGSYTYSIVTNNSGATINGATGAYLAGSTGSVNDTVRVTDGLGATSDTTVTVTAVLLIAPAATSIAPLGPVAFSASGGDGVFTYSILTNNSGGSINGVTGAYTAGSTGSVVDTVRVTDGLGVTSDAAVTVTAVLSIAPATVARPPLGAVAFVAADGNGTYTYSLLTNNSGGSINGATGAYVAGATGGVADTVRVTDGFGATADATVTVTAAIAISPATFSTPPLGGTTFTASGGDGTYTYSLLTNNSGGTINVSTGVYSAGATGGVADTVRVADGLGSTSDAVVTVSAAVAIAPASFATPPLGGTTFTASGGDGAFTFSLFVNNSGGSINGVSGVYAAGPTGGASDTVRVTDGLGGISSATVTVTAATAISPSTVSVAPTGPVAFSASGGDATYTYSFVANNSGGSLNVSTGAYVAGSTGSVTDTVRVTDGLGGTSDATVTVGPVLAIAPAAPSVAPGGGVAFSASGGDSTYTYSFVTNLSGGSINVATGAYVAGTTGSVNDVVRVTDGLSVTSDATVTVGPNLSINPAVTTSPPLGSVTFNGVGGDGSYTFSFVTNLSGGSINAVSGAYVAGPVGSVADVVRVTDGLSFTADATINVGLVIAISPASASGAPLSGVSFSASGGDGSYTFTIVTNLSGGSINASTGAYLAGATGGAVDTVRVTDGLSATSDAAVTVTAALAISPASFSTPPLGGTTFTASGGDGSYTYSFVTNNSGGSINGASGVYLAGTTGTVTDTVRVTDGLGATSTATITVTAAVAISPTSANLIPLQGQNFTASGGNSSYTYSLLINNSGGTINSSTGAYVSGTTGSVTDTVRVTDGLGGVADATVNLSAAVAISPTAVTLTPLQAQTFTGSGGNGTYTYAIFLNNSGGTINAATGAYTAGATGSVSDTIRVTDGLGGIADAIANVGGALTITPATATRAPLGSVAFVASGGSPAYTYSMFVNNSGGSVNPTTGAYTAGTTGSVSDTVRVTDSLFATSDAVITLTAAVTISPSTAAPPPFGAVAFSASGGNGVYTFSILTNNSGGSINATTGAYLAGATGSVVDTVRVVDSLGGISDATVTVGANLAIAPSTATPAPFGGIAFSASGGNGSYTYTIPVNNSGGSINVSTGAYLAGATGSVVDTVRVTDGLFATSDATVTVGANLAITPPNPSVAPTGPVAFSATGGDGSYTYSIVTNNSGGSIVPGTGAYLAGAVGSVSDTVRVTDGLGATSDTTVTVTAVLAIAPASASIAPLGPVAFSASGGDGSYTYSILTNNSGGVIDSGSGAYSAGTTGSVVDTVRVTDGLGVTSDSAVTVTAVLSIAPVSISRPPLGAVAFGAAGGNGVYTYSIPVNNSGGSINPTTGAYLAGSTGSVSDTVRVSDGFGATVDATVTVTAALAISPATFSNPPLGGTTFSATGGDGTYTFSIFADNSGGTINPTTGVYSAGTTGGVTDTIRVTDGLGATSDSAVTVTAAVAISPASFSTAPLGGTTFTASGGDASYTYTLFVNNSGGSIGAGTGVYVAGPTGSVADTVRVTDGLGGVSSATVTVTAAVAISPATVSVAPTGPVAFSVTGGSGPFTYTILVDNSGGSINATTGAYLAGATGSVADTVRVTDSLGATSDSTVTVGPVLQISPVAPSVAVTGSIAFSATGGDGTYIYTIFVDNSGGSIVAGTGAYTAGGVSATDTVRVTDGLGVTSDATVTVTP